jgi:hypothetical protein
MYINASFDFAAGATQSDISQFQNAVNTVINYFESVFTNINVTLNVKFAYGEQWAGNPGGSLITYTPMANATSTGTFLLGATQTPWNSYNYTTVRNQLLTESDTLQSSAYSTLPATSPFPSGDTLWLSSAQQKALGLTPTSTIGGFDGVVGIISNEELAAGGFTADWTKTASANSKQYYMIGSIEHELSELMGRVSFDGTNAINNAPSYTIMDLFRFANGGWLGPLRATAPNTGSDYFSIDNGAQAYYYWNNSYNGSTPVGDLGDWAASGPNGTDSTGNDAFLNNSNPGVVNEVSAYDLDLMNVVGWDLSPHFGLSFNGPPPAGTTSAMILRRLDGSYQLADIGNDSILSSYSFNQPGANWGIDWHAVALGSFADGDTTDLLLRNTNASDPNAGAFEVYNIINNNITSGALAGTVSLDWWTLGFGNFSSRGETDMLMRNSKTNDVAIYDIKNDQITGSFDLGNIGSDWQVQSGLFGLGKIAPIGNFSSRGESDLILRNVNTGELKVWDISNNQVTNTASLGTMTLDWQIVGSGDFSSRPGETDLMLRNVNSNALEVVDISNNQMSGPYSIGSTSSSWAVVEFGPMNSLGSSSMMLRDSDTGALTIFDIGNNQLTNVTQLGIQFGADWQIPALADVVTPTVTVSIDNRDVNVARPTATVSFVFSEAPIAFTLADVTATGGTLGNLQKADPTHYTATFTGSANTKIGNAAVSVTANSWQEAWGNFGTGGSTGSFTVDTIAPQVRVAIDNTDLNLGKQTGTGTFLFSEAPISFTLANTTLSGGTLSNLQLVGSTFGLTEYTATFTAAANTDISNASVSVIAGSWQEADGNLGTAGSTGSFTVDTVTPTVTVTTDNTFVNQAHTTGKITFTFSEAPTTFALADTTATGGAVSNLQEVDATHYTATFTGSANTRITNASVGVSARSWQENNGNAGAGGSTALFQVDTITPPSPPALSASSDPTAAHRQVIALSTLVSISDPFGLGYQQLQLWDSNGTASGGQFVINGVAQSGGHEIDLTAADAGKTVFDVGTVGGTDTVWARLLQNNGVLTTWQAFTVTAPGDIPPTVSVSNLTAAHGQSFAASSLFTASDADGDPIAQYAFWDTGTGGGHFELNGGAQAVNHEIDVTAVQLSQLSYQSGSGTDTLWVRANDGVWWSDWSNSFTVTTPIDTPPTVSVSNMTATRGQSFSASSLFTASDTDGEAITKYAFWDTGSGGGHFLLNGAAQGTNQEIDVTAAQLSQLSYQSGSGADTLWVRANDGAQWSLWSNSFTVTAPIDTPPTVSVSNMTATHGQSFAASGLFTAKDADGDAIAKYAFWDTGGGGHFLLNGVAQSTNQEIDVTAAQLSQLTYQSVSGADTLWVRANDGAQWSPWSNSFTVTAPIDTGPEVTPTNASIKSFANQTFAASSLISYSDPFGSPATQYDFWDSGSGGGHFLLNGSALPANQDNFISTTQLGQLSYQVGTGSDTLWARANDGTAWGAWSKSFTISDPPAVAAGETITLGSAYAGAVSFLSDTGTLKLEDSSRFAGTVAGLCGQDAIDLADIGFGANSTVGYAANADQSGGTLSVGDGTHMASIALLGSYMASTFVAASDGHGGTLISEAAHASTQMPVVTQPHA